MMNFLSTYDAPLRSYIQDRITVLENALEDEVRNRGNVDIGLLEEEFDRESDDFIGCITRRVHQIRDEIKSHRPRNIQAPDYELRMIQYRQFIQSSSIGINRITDWINSIFEQVIIIVKSIIHWLVDNVQTIVDVLKQIRDAFTFLGTFFNFH